MAVKAQTSSTTITFIQLLNTKMNQKYPKSPKFESEIKNIPGTTCTPLRSNKYHEVTYSRQWGHREVFKKDGTLGV